MSNVTVGLAVVLIAFVVVSACEFDVATEVNVAILVEVIGLVTVSEVFSEDSVLHFSEFKLRKLEQSKTNSFL